ncbi:MAG: Fic family protein [Planctomycetes bacterium]|nr:Fic family protein [Planctomycetota bacterium]
MRTDPGVPRATLLERLDLALAEWITDRASEDIEPGKPVQGWRWTPEEPVRHTWIAGLLAIRGYAVRPVDVEAVLAGRPGRFQREHQEAALIRGMRAALTALEARVADDRPPDGWWLVLLFRALSGDLRRFRNNSMRRDVPWDALRGVVYPPPDAVGDHLDAFHVANGYGDAPERFARSHPVLRAARIAWRFARIAPFPDLNLPMAMLAASTSLMLAGYPPLVVGLDDRPRLERFVRGRLPQRARLFAELLLETVPLGRPSRA